VSFDGALISGTDARNYNLVLPSNLTAAITAKQLQVLGITADGKEYDGTDAVTIDAAGAVFSGVVGGDDVSLDANATISAAFASANAGEGVAVTISGYALDSSGTDVGNYTLAQPNDVTADIDRRLITVAGLTADDRTYDGTVDATFNIGSANFGRPTELGGTAVIAADTANLTIATATGEFEDKNAGTNKPVTLTEVTLDGSAAANYEVVITSVDGNGNVVPLTGSATISPAAITISAADVEKVYDGTLTVSDGEAVASSGQLFADDQFSGGSFAFTDKNVSRDANNAVLSDKTVTVSGVGIDDGNNGTNYTITLADNTTSTITPAPITITGIAGVDRVYDGTTSVDVTDTGVTITGLVANETGISLDLTSATGTMDDRHANELKPITVSGITLGGTGAGNYDVESVFGAAEGELPTVTITPAPLTVTIEDFTKTYDATTAVDGAVAIVDPNSNTQLFATDKLGEVFASFDDKNAGSGKTITLTGVVVVGEDYATTDEDGNAITALAPIGGNYTITLVDNTNSTIEKADLVLEGLSAQDKVYDASTSATLEGTAFVSALASDVVSLDGSGSGAFANANVELDATTGDPGLKQVSISGYTISGSDSANYNLVMPSDVLATITPVSLSLSGISVDDKTYDASTIGSYTLSSTTLSTGIGSETLTIRESGFDITGEAINARAVFSGKDVAFDANGNVTTVAASVEGFSLGNGTNGGLAVNYVLELPGNLSATINQAALTVSGAVVANKVYDTTTEALLQDAGSVSALGRDQVNVDSSEAIATFDNKNAGTGKSVTLSGYKLSGADAANYTIGQPTGLTADITPADLVLSGISIDDKTYDGSTTATANIDADDGITITALLGDTVTLSGTASAAFTSANAGTDVGVTVSGLSLGGTDAGNYQIVTNDLTATIFQRAVTISGATAAGKTYDGTTTTTISGGSLAAITGETNSGVISADSSAVSLDGSNATGTFADKNVAWTITYAADGITETGRTAAAKDVSVSGFSLTGGAAGNYRIEQPEGLSATINPAALTISGITAATREYDGSTDATLDFSGLSLSGLVSGDQILVDGTGVFADANAGSGKTVNLTTTVSGIDVENYTVTEQTTATGTISKRTLTLSGITAEDKEYDGGTSATVDFSAVDLVAAGLIVGTNGIADDVSISSVAGMFTDANAGGNKTVNLTITGGGTALANYNFGGQTTTTATINPKLLTISGTVVDDKTYDGSTNATFTTIGNLSGLVGTQSLTVSAAGSFASKNVVLAPGFDADGDPTGSDVPAEQAVTVSYTLADGTGGLASNYRLADEQLTAVISPAALTITANDGKKVITELDPTLTVRAAGFVAGETTADLSSFSVSRAAGEDAGTYAITVSADSTNYDLTITDGTFKILGAGELLVTLGDVTAEYGTGAASGTTNARYYSALSQAIVTLSDISGDANSGFTIKENGADVFTYGVTTVEAAGNADRSAGGALNVGSYQIQGAYTNNTLADSLKVGYLTGAEFSDGWLTVTPQAINALSITSGGTRQYDGTTAMAPLTLEAANQVSGDALSISGRGTYASANAGDNLGYTLSGLALSGADAANYFLSANSFTVAPGASGVSITPKQLTVTGSSAADKTYDGNDSAVVTAGTLSGFVGTETVRISSASGLFASADVARTGDAITGTVVDQDVTATYTLTNGSGGGLASNYTVLDQTLQAAITPKTLTLTGVTVASRDYDGSTTVDASQISSAGVGLSGVINSDAVGVNTGTISGTYNSKDVATATTASLSGFSLTGDKAGNYSLGGSSVDVVASITAKALTISGSTVADKAYDGNANATVTANSLNLSGLIGSETLGVSATGSFASQNVAYSGVTVANQDVTVSYALADGTGLASNYSLSGEVLSNAAKITAKALTITGSTAADKVYDGDTSAVVTAGSLSGFIGSETVTIATATGQFASADVARNGSGDVVDQNVTATYTLANGSGGGLAGNYSLADTTGIQAAITPKALTITGASVTTRDYDGTTGAAIDTSGATLGGLVGSQTLDVSGSGTFDSKNVGLRTATVTYSLADSTGSASNYSLDGSFTLNGYIDPKAITITAPTVSKTYDGSTAFDLDGADVLALNTTLQTDGTLETRDSLTAASVRFLDKDTDGSAGVVLTGVTINDGNFGDNYNVTFAQGTGTIDKQDYVVWIGGTSGDWFDPNNWAVGEVVAAGSITAPGLNLDAGKGLARGRAGAVPDKDNVRNVVIPVGVDITFNDSAAGRRGAAKAGEVVLENLLFDGFGTGTAGELKLTTGTLKAASVKAGGLDLALGSTLDVSGSIDIELPNGRTSIAAGTIQGAAPLVVKGDGVLRLIGSNTFVGNATIDDGAVLEINSDAALGDAANAITLTGGGVLRASGTTTIGAGRAISLGTGGGSLEAASGKTLTLSSAVSGSGSGNDLVLGGTGTIDLGHGVSLSSGAGISGGSGSYNVKLGGSVSVAGATTLNTTGTIELTGGNTYNFTGGFNAASGSTTKLAGSIDTSNSTISLGNLVLTGTTTLDTVNSPGDNVTISGAVSGDYDLTITAGSGTVTFADRIAVRSLDVSADAISFDAAYLVDGNNAITSHSIATTGTQLFQGGGGSGTDAAITLGANTSLQGSSITLMGAINSAAATSNNLVIAGDAVFGGAAGSTVGSTTALGNLSVSGSTTLDADTSLSSANLNLADVSLGAHALTLKPSTTGTVSGVISGGGSLAMGGSGTLSLNGANTYSGGSSVTAGTLVAGDNAAFGAGSVGVSSGAALDLAGFSVANDLNLAGTGVSDSGALFNSATTAATASGAISLSGNTSISTAGDLTLSGGISDGSGGNNAELILSNAAGQSGRFLLGADVTTGGLQRYLANVEATSAVTVTASSLELSANLSSSGLDLTVAAPITLLDNGSGTPQTRTVSTGSGAGNLQLAAITGANNSLSLISGTGTTTVSGAVSGVNALSLQVANATGAVSFQNNLSATSLTTAAAAYNLSLLGSTTNFTDAVSFANTGTLTLGDGDSDRLVFSGGITATAPSAVNLRGTLEATGSSTITLGDADTGVVISGITRIGGPSDATSSGTITLSAVTLADGASLTLGDAAATASANLGSNAITLTSVAAAAGSTTAPNLTINSTGAVQSGAIGVASGTDTNTELGTITLTRAGGATFTGAVNAASLEFADGVASSSDTIAVQGDLTLTSGLTVGTGDYAISLTGASNSIAGNTAFSNTGTVTLGDASSDGFDFVGGLSFSGNAPISLAAAVESSTGSLHLGSGTLTLAANSELAAATDLTVAGSLSGSSRTLTIAAGNTNTASFLGTVTLADLITSAGSYGVSLTGASNTFTSAIDFANTGVVSLGDATTDTFSFNGGLSFSGNSAVNLGASIRSSADQLDFGNGALTLVANSVVDATNGGDQASAAGNTIHFGGAIGNGANSFNLSLDAGTGGAITLVGAIGSDAAGSEDRIGALTIANANVVSFGGRVVAGSFTQSAANATTGSTTFEEGFDLAGDLAFTGQAITLKGSNTATGSATFTNAGEYVLASGGSLSGDGGITFNGTGATRLAGGLSSTGASFSFGSRVVVDEAITISTGTGAGNISFDQTVSGSGVLTLAAGTGDVIFAAGADVGTSAAKAGGLEISGRNITLRNVYTTGQQDYSATGTITTNSSYVTEGAAVRFAGATVFNDHHRGGHHRWRQHHHRRRRDLHRHGGWRWRRRPPAPSPSAPARLAT
jgi:hypothetical protein